MGHDEDAVAPVRGADGGCWYAIPRSIIPERGQVPENMTRSPSKETWDVLQHDVAGSNLANDAGNLSPEPSVVVDAASGSCRGPRLAGEARSDAIHDATPASAVEGANIVPDRSWLQGLFFHPCHEDGR